MIWAWPVNVFMVLVSLFYFQKPQVFLNWQPWFFILPCFLCFVFFKVCFTLSRIHVVCASTNGKTKTTLWRQLSPRLWVSLPFQRHGFSSFKIFPLPFASCQPFCLFWLMTRFFVMAMHYITCSMYGSNSEFWYLMCLCCWVSIYLLCCFLFPFSLSLLLSHVHNRKLI